MSICFCFGLLFLCWFQAPDCGMFKKLFTAGWLEAPAVRWLENGDDPDIRITRQFVKRYGSMNH